MSRRHRAAIRHPNNTWYALNHSQVVVVFVHGLFSDSASCWSCERQTGEVFWPELVAKDLRLASPSIFLGGYHTTPEFSATRYGLADCANELMRALRTPDARHNAAVLDKQTIVFVCHSAGGAVVRYLLDTYAEEFAGKVVGLLLLASPSNGSRYASLLSLLPGWRDALSAQLAWGNEILNHVDQRFRGLLQSRRIPAFFGAEAFESTPTGLGVLGNIVHRESAARYFADPAHLAGTDHHTICKPDCEEHESHRFLVEFVTKRMAMPGALPARSPAPVAPVDTKLVLFEFYTNSCEPYYIERGIDKQSARALDVSNLWLWGSPGCGKTSVIRRVAITAGMSYIYVSLGHIESNSVASVLRDIWLTLQQRLKLPNPSVPTLPIRALGIAIVDLLAKHFPNHLIHLDEIPISDPEVLKALWGEVEGIIVGVREQNPGSNMRLAISSVADPELRIAGKGLSERLQVLENSRWEDAALRSLVEKIGGALKIDLGVVKMGQLVVAANGSPRFVKKVLRAYLIRDDKSDTAFAALLEETRRELR